MADRKNPAADLETPAGEPAPPMEGVITNVTARRRELLRRLAEDDTNLGRETPEEAAAPGEANRQVYEAERAGRQQ